MGKYDGYDPNTHRTSISYILGFSNKPFKPRDDAFPRLPKPGQSTAVVDNRAKLFEWVASDGRKGKLNGNGKSRAPEAPKEETAPKANSTTSKRPKKAVALNEKGWDTEKTGWDTEKTGWDAEKIGWDTENIGWDTKNIGDSSGAEDTGKKKDPVESWGGGAWGNETQDSGGADDTACGWPMIDESGSNAAKSTTPRKPKQFGAAADDTACGWPMIDEFGPNAAKSITSRKPKLSAAAADNPADTNSGNAGANAANPFGTDNADGCNGWASFGAPITQATAGNIIKEAKDVKDTTTNGNNNGGKNDPFEPNDISKLPNPYFFTKEQDDKLWMLKNQLGQSISWKDIHKIDSSKTGEQYKHRWAQLKPKNWRPPTNGKGDGKVQDQGTKGKNGGNGNADNQHGGNKESSNDNYEGAGYGGGMLGIFGIVGPDEDTTNKKGTGGGKEGCSQAGNTGRDNQDKSKVTNRQNTVKPASATGSRHSTKHSALHQTTLTPDKTFSLRDLKILATIAKEDNDAAYSRIADRFWDKTDRRILPEVFERKLTGHCAREDRHKEKEKTQRVRRDREREKQKAFEEELRRQKEWDRQRAKAWEEEMARRARRVHFGSYH